jgi:hypothetical protein
MDSDLKNVQLQIVLFCMTSFGVPKNLTNFLFFNFPSIVQTVQTWFFAQIFKNDAILYVQIALVKLMQDN